MESFMNEPLIELEKELVQINKTRHGRRAFLQALPLLLASCATKPRHADRHREGDNTGQETSLTYEDERRMTEEYLPEMKKEYPPHRNKEAQRYINDVGQKIVKANGLHKNPYTYSFTVCDSKNVNAFALPAGTVFVTAPLIAMSESEAELAGVIGHEIGHIQARHTAERIELAKREQNRTILYGIGGALLGGAAGVGLSRLVCKREDRECMRRIALYGAAAGAGGGLLIQKFAFMANSREDEMEADRIGFRTSLAAGYDREHIGLFYSRLLEMERQYQQNQSPLLAPLTDAMSTHPPSRERVLQMEQMAREAPKTKGKVSSKEFDKIRHVLN
jgi:beta-barrel assembly-enhancing protease